MTDTALPPAKKPVAKKTIAKKPVAKKPVAKKPLSPEEIRASVVAEVTDLAARITLRNLDERNVWLTIGDQLLTARNSFGPNAALEFGAWVKSSGIAATPGLTNAAARSDAIWCAEYPDRVSLVDEAVEHPRTIRAAWRKLYAHEVMQVVEKLVTDKALTPPEIESAAEDVAFATLADPEETFTTLKHEVEMVITGAAQKLLLEKALPKLARALQAAANAGVSSGQLASAASEVWGGHFVWQVSKPKTEVHDG